MSSEHLLAYLAAHDRIEAAVLDCDENAEVPACPGWRVRDVVAHLAGLCEDWVDHRTDGYASDEWTAAQVARSSGQSLTELVARWRRASASFGALDDDPVMGQPAVWAFGDAVCHEADIYGAVGSGHVPHDAVVLGLGGLIGRWRGRLTRKGTPTLLLRAPDARDWWLGVPDDPDAVTAEASADELFRALAGRRSESQVRTWVWSSDADLFLRAGLPYPFRWSQQDLVEP
jgi:uncharacterized protein (TIGR03083 family)